MIDKGAHKTVHSIYGLEEFVNLFWRLYGDYDMSASGTFETADGEVVEVPEYRMADPATHEMFSIWAIDNEYPLLLKPIAAMIRLSHGEAVYNIEYIGEPVIL